MAEDQKAVETKPEVAEVKVTPPTPPVPPPAMAPTRAPAPPQAKAGRKPNDRSFKVNVRIEYPTDSGMTEVLPGEIASGIPSNTIKPWLAQGIIEEVTN